MSDNAGDPDDIDEVDETVEEELEEAMSAGTDTGIQFHGGKWMSAFPLAFFVLWAIVQSGPFRIGDTVLEIPGAPTGMVDSRVALRVTEFDPSGYEGRAEFVEKVGESAF